MGARFRRRRLIRPTWALFRAALSKARKDRVSMIAQALAYSLFLAIPATGLVALGVFSLVADDREIQSLVHRAEAIVPTEAAGLFGDSLERSARSTRSGILLTGVGLALALWTTSSAATTLMEGVTRVFGEEDERSFLRRRLLAVLIVLALVFSAALVVTSLVLGPLVERWVGSALHAKRMTAWVWWTVQWPVLVTALMFAFGLVLYVAPHVRRQSWRHVLPGAAVAMVIWLVGSGVFAVYAAHFGSYNKSWGTLSAVVITLIWLWLTSAALLLGAEVNAEARRLRHLQP